MRGKVRRRNISEASESLNDLLGLRPARLHNDGLETDRHRSIYEPRWTEYDSLRGLVPKSAKRYESSTMLACPTIELQKRIGSRFLGSRSLESHSEQHG